MTRLVTPCFQGTWDVLTLSTITSTTFSSVRIPVTPATGESPRKTFTKPPLFIFLFLFLYLWYWIVVAFEEKSFQNTSNILFCAFKVEFVFQILVQFLCGQCSRGPEDHLQHCEPEQDKEPLHPWPHTHSEVFLKTQVVSSRGSGI